MWVFWALFSAVLVASRRPIEKNTISHLHHFSYAFWVQCFSLPLLSVIVILSGKWLNPLTLGVGFWSLVLLIVIAFHPLSAYLYKKALVGGELSKVLPLQSLGPIVTLLLAGLTLAEIPSIVSSFGVILTVLGVYVLGLKGKRLHHPLRPFKEDGSSRAMLLLVVLVAAVSLLEKLAIRAANPEFYALVSATGAIIVLSVSIMITGQKFSINLKQFAPSLGTIGILQGSTYVTYLLAIATGPVAYVASLRSTNILMGSLLGVFVFRERISKPKILSFMLIITGALCLTAGS